MFLHFPLELRGASARLESYINSTSRSEPLEKISTIFLSSLDIMTSSAILDHNTAKSLLRPIEQNCLQAEDKHHSWMAYPSQHSDGQLANPFAEHSSTYKALEGKPLLRVWDTCSGSIPDPSRENRMLARLPRGELATKDARRASLTIHADQKKWEKTPYISFTSSPRAAVELILDRMCCNWRGDQNLVVIDPEYRLKLGLPILDMGKEMEVYGVKDPYPYSTKNYFLDHYLCLWEVTPAEVVGIWSWGELRGNKGWYENIIMPAFQRHRTAGQRAMQTATRDVDALSSILARTYIDCELKLSIIYHCYC